MFLSKLCNLSDVVKNEVAKNARYNAKIKYIEDKIPDITNLGTITSTAITTAENKIPDHSKYITSQESNK